MTCYHTKILSNIYTPQSLGRMKAASLSIAAQDVHGIFSYGTLRGDFLPSDNGEEDFPGDKWGVVERYPNAHIHHGFVAGFKLYQERGLFYPYVVRAPGSSSNVKGTLMMWDDKSVFARALEKCDQIEGWYGEGNAENLYNRTVVNVELEGFGETKAFIYFQTATLSKLEESIYFPDGDWSSEFPRNNITTASSEPNVNVSE